MKKDALERRKKKEAQRKLKIALCWVAVAAVVVLGIFISFRPVSFTEIATEKHAISVVLNDFEIVDGKMSGDAREFQNLAAEEKAAVLELLEQYTYRKTFDTIVSNGKLSDIGHQMLSIHAHDGVSEAVVLVVTSSGQVSVNGVTYRMEGAEQLIEKVLEVVE